MAFLVSGPPVLAQAVLPSAPSVAAGAAVVSAPTATSILVTQSSRNAIINWGAFSIGAGQSVRFENGGGATLNRVTGPLPSQIDGSLSATGSVFLVNPNGIVIGPTGQIVTGGSFIASTHDVRDAEFMAGGAMTFRSTSTASVINYGSIGALGGDVALIARKVENAGTITAPNGTAALAAGYEVLVRDGALSDGKFVVKVGGADTEAKTRGVIRAAEVELKANGGNVYALAGNTASVTKATGVANRGGRVFLTAGNGGTVRVTQTVTARKSNGDGGTIRVAGRKAVLSGTLDVRGKTKGAFGAGGRIVVTARDIALATGAVLDASGGTGGLVLVGGDYQGGRDAATKYLAEEVETAQTVSVASGATIRADGMAGAGGRVVVWSDAATDFAGAISARGTSAGGDAEVSGKALLSYRGTADLTGAPGRFGTLLLDPYNLTISDDASSGMDGFNANADDSVLNATTLANALATANVTVTTGSGGSQAGDITVATNVTWTGATTLTLSAYRNITVNGNLTGTTGSAIALRADNTGTGTGTVTFGSALATASGGVSIYYNPTSYTSPTSYSSNAGTSTAVTGYMLVNTLQNLQDVSTNLSGAYALGRNIDASATSTWNSGAGFAPIGTSTTNFTGKFDGLGQVISGLTINRSTNFAGLFGYTTNATLRNIGLSGGSITGGTSTGALVGILGTGSTVSKSYSSATVNGTQAIGGLVGNASGGRIEDSYSTGNVTASGNPVGGLVGIGQTSGSITRSFATGEVKSNVASGTANVGGLVGSLTSSFSVSQSYATGKVTATGSGAGGLVGSGSAATITQSYATGAVNGGTNAGGLVGTGSSSLVVSKSYATGAVTGILSSAGTNGVGGLIGLLSGTARVSESYATGAVSVTNAPAGTNGVGGLIGTLGSTGSVSQSYAIGTVSGTANVGGLVGSITSTGTVSESYAVGAVSGTTNVGGLIGNLATTASLASSFFDSTTTGRTSGVGSNSTASGVTALTTAQFQDTAGFMARASTWSFTSTWAPSSSGYYPQLYSVNPVIAVTGGETSSVYGNSTGTLTGYTGSSGGPSTYAFGSSGDSITLAGTIVPANATANAGTAATDFNINASQASTGGVTYRVFIYGAGTTTVTARPLSVAADPQSMTYGDALPALTYAITSGSLVNGDSLSGSLATLASSTANVGTYGITQGTLGNPNYAITYTGADVTISARPITVTANAESMFYGDAVPALTYSVTSGSLVNSDSLTGALATLASSTADVGTYAITQGTLGNSNYAITYTGADVTISARPITVTANAQSMTYGDAVPALTYSVTSGSLVNSDSLTGSLATLASSTANVGAYGITQGTLAASSNYVLTYDSADVTVSARPITVTANAESMTYGDAVPALTYSVTSGSLVNSDSLTGSLATLASSTADVGTYAITQGTLGNPNYAITYTGADVTISARPLTVAANAQSMIYGNAAPALTYSVISGSLVNGDSLSGALASLASSTANVGAYAITQGTLGNPNYALTYDGANVTVTSRPLTVAANAQAMTYGNAVPALSYTLTSGTLVNGDTLTGALATLASSSANVGGYAITQGTLAASSNYALAYLGAELTVLARAITATAENQSRSEGAANPPLTYLIGGMGLVNGDAFSGSLSTPAAPSSPAGLYPILQGSLSLSDNYALTYVAGELAILPVTTPVVPVENAVTGNAAIVIPASLLISASLLVPQPPTDQWSVTIQTDSLAAISAQGTTDSSDASANSSDSGCAGGGACTDRPHSDNRNFGRWLTFRAQ
ncbi:MAG: MBG domain-containing protein [Pseudomonadota bacterium]